MREVMFENYTVGSNFLAAIISGLVAYWHCMEDHLKLIEIFSIILINKHSGMQNVIIK
jgi:hypothetical protein